MDSVAFRRFRLALDAGGQQYRFSPEEYEYRRNALNTVLYLIYESSYLGIVRRDIDYAVVRYVMNKYLGLVVFIFTNYFPELSIARLSVWL